MMLKLFLYKGNFLKLTYLTGLMSHIAKLKRIQL